MDYLKLLVEGYEDSRQMECPVESKVEYLALHLFDFTTYDAKMDVVFGEKALEVFRAINERKTFEYISDEERYRWYLIMCNMPFFTGRLEWGTSIRGAWWAYKQPPLESCGLYLNGEQITKLTFKREHEWKAFADAVIEFSKD